MSWNGWVVKNAQFLPTPMLFHQRNKSYTGYLLMKIIRLARSVVEEQSWREQLQRKKWIKPAFLLGYVTSVDLIVERSLVG
jgi:hypothetical protein